MKISMKHPMLKRQLGQLLFGMIGLGLSFLTTHTQAASTFDFSPYIGFHQFKSDRHLSDTFEIGVNLRKPLIWRLEGHVRVGVLQTFDKAKSASDTMLVVPVNLNLVAPFWTYKGHTAMGILGYQLDSQGGNQIQVGLGLGWGNGKRDVQVQTGESSSVYVDMIYVPIAKIDDIKKAKDELNTSFSVEATPIIQGNRPQKWTFNDIEGHWCEQSANALATLGIIEKSDAFYPNQTIIRSEAALWLANLTLFKAASQFNKVAINLDPRYENFEYSLSIQDSIGNTLEASPYPESKTVWSWNGSGITPKNSSTFFVIVNTNWSQTKSNPILMVQDFISMDDWDLIQELKLSHVVPPSKVDGVSIPAIETLTRIQFIEMMNDVLAQLDMTTTKSVSLDAYTDIQALSNEERAALRNVMAHIGPIGSKVLDPYKEITRDQASVLLFKLYNAL